MSVFNPGRLQDISRFTAPQPIIPGSGQYDYGSAGGQGRPVPAVGAYPSGAPGMGLAGGLADDSGDDSGGVSTGGLLVAAIGIFATIWMIELFTTTRTAIKTAPRIIPFLGS